MYKTIAALALFALFSGCTAVPTAEYASYTEAYSNVKDESEKLLVELSAAFNLDAQIKQDKQAADKKVASRPFPMEATGANSENPGEEDILVRRKALELISLYNTTLSDLAAGKSPEQVSASANSLITGLNSFGSLVGAGSGASIPFVNEVSTLIGTLVQKLQEAQNRALFVDAMRAGAPILSKLFAQLQLDANEIYHIRALDAEKRTLAVQIDIANNIGQMLTVAKAGKPAANDTEKAELANVQTRLNKLIKDSNLPTYPPLVLAGATTPLTPLLLSQLQQTLAQLEASAKQYQAIVSETNANHDWVQSYKKMVIATNNDLNAVVTALDRPVDMTAAAGEIIGFVFQVKRDFQALQTARAAAAGS